MGAGKPEQPFSLWTVHMPQCKGVTNMHVLIGASGMMPAAHKQQDLCGCSTGSHESAHATCIQHCPNTLFDALTTLSHHDCWLITAAAL